MTGPLSIGADERGLVRVFQLSDTLARDLADADSTAPLARALGVDAVDPDHLQIIAPRAMDDLGLAGLLEHGHGIAPGALAPDRALLAGLGGTVAILRSRAFGPEVRSLDPVKDCRLVATYAEAGAPPPRFEPLHSTGAEGTLGGAPPAEAPEYQASRRTLLIGLGAAVVLAVIVLLLTRGGA